MSGHSSTSTRSVTAGGEAAKRQPAHGEQQVLLRHGAPMSLASLGLLEGFLNIHENFASGTTREGRD